MCIARSKKTWFVVILLVGLFVLHYYARADAGLRFTLLGHTGPVYAVAFSPNDPLLVSAGHDGTVRFWEIESSREKFVAHLESMVKAVVFSPQGDRCASGDDSGQIVVWSTNDFLETHHFRAPAAIRSIAFSPSGDLLAVTCYDNLIHLYRLTDHDESVFVAKGVDRIAFAGSDNLVLATFVGRSAQLLDLAKFSRSSFVGDNDAWCVATNANEKRLVMASLSGHASVYSIDKKNEPVRLSVFHAVFINELNAVCWSTNGEWIALASGRTDSPASSLLWRAEVIIWNSRKEEIAARFRGHWGAVSSVSISNDNKYVASGCYDGVVRIWDMPGDR